MPPYRSINAQLYINQMGGYEYMTHHPISHSQIPKDLRRFVPDKVHLRQSAEELSQMAASSRELVTMTGSTFGLVASEWTNLLGEFQSVSAIYFEVSTPSIAGVVDMVRNTLVDMVFDLAKDLPLDELPNGARVDSVVQVHIGSQDNSYNVNVTGNNTGVIGQGDGSSQVQNHSAPSELVLIVAQLRAALTEVSDPDQRSDAEQAIDDFEEAASADNPEPEKVKRRWGILERVATALGVAAVTQAVKDGAPIVAEQIQVLM